MTYQAERLPASSSRQSAPKRMRQNHLVSGEQLKAARILAGLSQKRLAAETGRSLRAITGWESTTGAAPSASRNSVQRIEAALSRHGVALYITPAGGCGVEKVPERLLERGQAPRQQARGANAD
jgi:transcriptional regulator with XRE-family HTH domain